MKRYLPLLLLALTITVSPRAFADDFSEPTASTESYDTTTTTGAEQDDFAVATTPVPLLEEVPPRRVIEKALENAELNVEIEHVEPPKKRDAKLETVEYRGENTYQRKLAAAKAKAEAQARARAKANAKKTYAKKLPPKKSKLIAKSKATSKSKSPSRTPASKSTVAVKKKPTAMKKIAKNVAPKVKKGTVKSTQSTGKKQAKKDAKSKKNS